jgi:uncharacterized protein
MHGARVKSEFYFDDSEEVLYLSIKIVEYMKAYAALTIAVAVICCSPKKEMTEQEKEAYQAEIETWHKGRLEKVKAPNGWLNLAGLLWLEQGINTFGSDASNNLVFPAGKIAGHAGYFLVEGNVVTLFAGEDAIIRLHGQAVKKAVVYHPDSAQAPIQESGPLRWNIIKRDTKLGIRLRDDDSELLHTFKGVERFAVDPQYRVEAVLKTADSTKVDITNVLGQTYQRPSPGTLVFTLEGREHKLTPIAEGDGEELFIIFADATSGKETYGGGRFLYVKRPGADGKVLIDFNKAYNPPCVFTPYATCPLPPERNVLPVAIQAGEKAFEGAGTPQSTVHG